MMAKWIITGASGKLARDISVLAEREGIRVTALSRADLDITDGNAVARACAGHEVIVNCAAYTGVDDAESNESYAFEVNAVGAGNVARAAEKAGAAIVHISTDYVFDGLSTSPYDEAHAPNPVTAYGRSKAAGELLVAQLCPQSWIVRTAWLYGAFGRDFVSTIVTLANEQPQIQVVFDQVGQPTWSQDVARSILRLVTCRAQYGVWHATSQGHASWYEFACEVFRCVNLDPARVKPISSTNYTRPAARPPYSVLGHRRWVEAGMPLIPDWRVSLRRALSEFDDLRSRARGS